MKFPFLFFVPERTINKTGKDYWVVKIAASFDYIHYSSGWMDDQDLPINGTLCPDVDICEEKHIFYSEEEAIAFIREWWKQG